MLCCIIIKQAIRSFQSKEKSRKYVGWIIFIILIIATVLLARILLPSSIWNMTKVRAKEAILKENLFRMREMINQYKSDNGYYPENLEVLVEEGYLRKIPIDPITRSFSTWRLIYITYPEKNDPNICRGLIDVKSGALGKSHNGTLFQNW